MRLMHSEAREQFQALVWSFYQEHGRHDLPWRLNLTPYGVFVSEIMLQQTQVSRVLGRWERWCERWPGFAELAVAGTAEALEEWHGMGYNRRALALKAAAQMVVSKFGGELPRDPEALVQLPGVGPNTAGSVAAFAYNEPVVFIETNIRRVFLYHYAELMGLGAAEPMSSRRRTQRANSSYPLNGHASASSDTVSSAPTVRPVGGAHEPSSRTEPASAWRVREGDSAPPGPAEPISDAQLRPLIEATLDRERPREWYWALMDYGADLAKRVPNPNRRSKHYTVQSRFEGSVRQLRGEVLRQLLAGPKTVVELDISDKRLEVVLAALIKEGFVIRNSSRYELAK